jgi:sulfite reductase (NADPH) flavoprotein alpha-component
MFVSLKYGAYLYVISGFLLALFTLHWQSKIPEISSQKLVSSASVKDANSAQTDLISLSASSTLSTYKVENSTWLVLLEKKQIAVMFSSRETAAILTLERAYNIALFTLLATLLYCFNKAKVTVVSTQVGNTQVSCKHNPSQSYLNKIKIKSLGAIVLIVLSQQFFDWSFLFNTAVINESALVGSHYLWLYLVLTLATFPALAFIITHTTKELHALKKEDALGNENIKESLIAYASQSGTAASIAKNIAQLLPKTSRYDVACVSSLDAHQLSDYQQVFLLASTYGDGEPPEQAMSFVSSLKKLEQPLNTVKYAVLALGDREYPKFCAFGHELAETLKQKGAQALLPVAEINRGHEASIQLWWQQLTHLLGWHSSNIEKAWQTQFTLGNDCLNPNASERPAHHIRLSSAGCVFSPGDLVEVMPDIDEVTLIEKINQQGWSPLASVNFQQQPMLLVDALKQLFWQHETASNPQALIDELPELAARTYSIASCQQQDSIDLLVRKVIKADNSVGLCSGYLAKLSTQQPVKIAIKTHHKFHPPSVEVPLIMIAAGTGLAPFIGFLEQRQRAANHGQSWLIMGERNKEEDNYFSDKLTAFEQTACLSRRQHAWSQGSQQKHANYVGDIMMAEQNDIRHWLLALDAQLYICGNAATLGVSCNKVLTDILGEEVFANLLKNKKIKFDLY